MPERPPRFERWRLLGRLLPAEVRERVFDPAFSDLLRAWLTRRPDAESPPFGLQAFGTYVGCVPFAIPRLFVRRGHLTRFGKIAVWISIVLILVWIVLPRTTGWYAAGG